MIEAVQFIGWSLLAPEPIRLQGPVVALVGRNGSGKSSALDGIKALLGARRFGQSRTPSSYRWAGERPVRRAYVIGIMRNPGLRNLPKRLTVVMEVSASKRRFLVLPGENLIELAQVDEQLAALRAKRGKWLSPEQYQARYLEPIGIGTATRRFLELPQGELHRALDRDPEQLVELLLELAGGRAAAERLERAEEALKLARRRQAEARHRAERARAELAEARLLEHEAIERRRLRAELAGLLAEGRALTEAREGENDKEALVANPRVRGLELRLGRLAVPSGEEARVAAELGPGETLPSAAMPGELIERYLVAGPKAASIGQAAKTESSAELGRLKKLLDQLEGAGIKPASSGIAAERRSAAELIGAIRALAGGDLAEIESKDLSVLESDARAKASVAEDGEEVIALARTRLEEARELYGKALGELVEGAAERFSELARRAGMSGRLELDGERIRILAAETPEAEPRPLHGSQASLSGGWRASVVLLAILSCLSAEHSPPVLLIDELGASLDEERLETMGQLLSELGGQGLMSIISSPTRNVSRSISSFADQQLAFFRPEPGQLAPPPHAIIRRQTRRRLQLAA